jgi:hypothetical protein
MTAAHINDVLLALFVLGACVLPWWIARLATLLGKDGADVKLVEGLNQLASSTDGGEGAAYRGAVGWVLGLRFAAHPQPEVRHLGLRVFVAFVAQALLGVAMLIVSAFQ